MPRTLWYFLILFISIVIAVIHGIIITPSAYIFLSWLFIGFWLCFTIKFLQRVNSQRDLNSPLNTGFFTLIPLLIGLLYSFFGYYTKLLEWNIFGTSMDIYLSPWTLMFAFPYLLYGSFSLYSCCTRYDFVYLGQQSFNGRRFGVFISGLMFTIVFLWIIYFYTVLSTWPGPFPPIHTAFDLMLLVLCSYTLYLIIRYGVFGRRPNIGQLSTRLAAQRQRRLIGQPVARPHSSTRSTEVRPRPQERKPKPVEQKPKPPERTPKLAEKRSRHESKSEMKLKLKKLRPVAGVLSISDFQCIFCFKLPQLPADQGRNIIVCPHCKHPAHADEFQNWCKTSTLCSRCSGTIPASFRRNPEIIRIKDYVALIRAYLKWAQKK